jgi:DNA repair protein RadC
MVGACALIIAHNHPSGDPLPSAADRGVAKRLADAGQLLGIRLLDSLVVVDGGGFHSMREAEPDLFQ